MFYFLKRVGCNYGILDSDDGAVDWIPKEEFDGYVKDGVDIVGVDKKTGELTPQMVELPASKCNWDGSENIFTNVRSFAVTAKTNKFELKAVNRKTFKGKLVKADTFTGRLEFNNGVYITITALDYATLLSRNNDEVLRTLRNLVVDDPIDVQKPL